MDIEKRKETFITLGHFLRQFDPDNPAEVSSGGVDKLNREFMESVKEVVSSAHLYNPWFTERNVRLALASAGKMLSPEKMEKWLSGYNFSQKPSRKMRIGVIMAGNIPLVGFHDMLCVLISGHSFAGKLSSKDDKLLPLLARIISCLEPEIERDIHFESGFLKEFDAVIATGSNNSARYFDYYFGQYPHIIRRNRNSAAILSGDETEAELEKLADDIFRYFGLGCRSVSKLYLPENFDFTSLQRAFSVYSHLSEHHKWDNNYRYRKAAFLMNKIPYCDFGFVLLKEDKNLFSPIGVIYYEHFAGKDEAWRELYENKEELQCIVSQEKGPLGTVPFGKAQEPELWNYPDNVDTIDFLLNPHQPLADKT